MDLATLQHEVESLEYYHPYLRSMEEVRSIMVDYIMQDGSFLLRNSFSKVGVLTVTVMHSNSIKHFNLGMRNGCFCLQDHLFPSVRQLVSFYKCNDVPNIEQVHHVRLLHPIPYTRSTRHRDSAPNPPAPRMHSNPHMFRSISVVNEANNNRSQQANQRSSSLQSDEPLLPQRKEGRKTFLTKMFHRNTPKRKSSEVLTPPSQPAPPPPREEQTESPYYSQVVDTQVDRTKELIYHLRQIEQTSSERCECGLTFEESELPNGWTMHISHDERTKGKLFFMGPDDQTVWNLPFEVTLELSADQQVRIRDLMLGNRQVGPRSSTGSSSNRSSNSSLSGAQAPRLKPTEHECLSDDSNQI